MSVRRDLDVIIKLNNLTCTKEIQWEEKVYCDYSVFTTKYRDITFSLKQCNDTLELAIINEEDQVIWTADSFIIYALRELYTCIADRQISVSKILEDFLK